MRLWVGVRRDVCLVFDILGYCRWSDDPGNLLWVVSAQDNNGQR